MRLSDFDFILPSELIAQQPAVTRDQSRLMVVDRRSGSMYHDVFSNIAQYLPPQAALVFNRSKVLNARLVLEDKQELFLLKEVSPKRWQCLVRPGKKFRIGERYTKTVLGPHGTTTIDITVEEDPEGARIVEFSGNVQTLMEQYGHLPLPPYIAQERAEEFGARYQTVYAQEQGSVAAPTAGLHFTEELLQELKDQGFAEETVLLHVGLGTFQPVKVENLSEHEMHSESFVLDEDTANRLNSYKAEGRGIVAVGTTSVRVLESNTHHHQLISGTGETNIFITPGYEFQFVDHLITNFHLPKSTLLMLVSAFAGPDLIKKAYQEAIQNHYRFYSFGDSMLII